MLCTLNLNLFFNKTKKKKNKVRKLRIMWTLLNSWVPKIQV